MDYQKFTEKSLSALYAAEQYAREYGNPEIRAEHMLYALLTQENGIIPEVVKGLNVNTQNFAKDVDKLICDLPKVQGQNGVYTSGNLTAALDEACKQAESMKDDYVSVEHLMLGVIKKADGKLKTLLNSYSIDKDAFLKALLSVRGNQRVTNQNPEDTYNALKKYGTNLTELARLNKLDPVIGRDDEIRNVIRILSRKTKNNHCGRAGVKNIQGRRPRIIKKPRNFLVRYGQSCSGSKVQGRI